MLTAAWIVGVLLGVWIAAAVSGLTLRFLTKMKMSSEYVPGSILNWPATRSKLFAAFLGVVVVVALVANIEWLAVLSGLPFAGFVLGFALRRVVPIKS